VANESDLQETFEQELNLFIGFLEVMAMEPVEQCEVWGNYNVAWELVTDLKNKGLIISTYECSYLTEYQKEEVKNFINSLSSVPETFLIQATTATENIKAMCHPVWEPIRKDAAKLIKILQSAVVRNNEYFA
jgi:Asp-tRNA(Asn)/Glu-tRNA(Gln) amidotransferase C subunit